MRPITPDITPPEWDALGDDVQADLVAWRNVSKPDAEDLRRLAALYNSGRFATWSCPACDEHVFEAQPEDWSHFQGADQNDRVSYPGNGPADKRCNYCRCHNK
jgi:hypothetical protein